ncbi:MAG: prolipoprotein diacylglyceryl transferase [Saprospiraceae bacterium]|nr:prolipoprotein diacylglyceryl transferase [Saprospiraceae bacterium]
MYPNLSYLIHALTGWGPDNAFSVVQTFGLMLAVSFLASAWFLSMELKRKEREGILHPVLTTIRVGAPPSWMDVAWNGLFGFLIGFKGLYVLQHGPAFQEDPAGVILSAQGSWVGGLLGLALLGGWKGWLRLKAKGSGEEKKISVWPHQRVWDMAMIAGICGVAGSKLFSLLEDPQALIQDPVGQIFSGSGLNFLGGLILGFVGVFTYIRMKKIPGIHLLDATAPALVVGYAVGRIGCQLSGDGDWGIVHLDPVPVWWFLPDWIWSFDYPHNVLNEGVPIEGCTWKYCHRLAEPVYPTPFYETVLGGVILALLWGLRKRIHVPGVLFFLYLVLISAERFLIEFIRVNDRYDILGFQWTQSQAISVLLFLVGLGGMVWLWNRSPKGRKA